MRVANGYFLSRLAAVAGLFMLPLFVLHGYTLYREYDDARALAIRNVQAQAADSRRVLDSYLTRAENLLRYLAAREELQRLDSVDCSRLLKGFNSVDPGYLNIGAIGLDGSRLCIATYGSASPPASFADAEWFPLLKDATELTFVGPFMGRVRPTPIALLAIPVRNAAGERVALIGITMRLSAIAESLQSPTLPAGSSVTLLGSANRVLARAPDFAQWVGREATVDMALRQRMAVQGFATATGIDGVQRIFAASEIPRYGLRISAGVPTDAILAPVLTQAIRGAALAGLVVLLGSVLAARWARGLTQPLQILRRATRDVASASHAVRVSENLPGEFRDLAQDFNHMASSLERTLADLRESTHTSVKLTRLYQALSGTNQAITKVREVRNHAELLQEICDICVDTGHATMAWIEMNGDADREGSSGIDSASANPTAVIAAAGRARVYLERTTPAFALADRAAAGPLLEALKTGKPCIVNDFTADPLTAPWHEYAAEFKIRASAAFPFTQGGEIAGVLNLCVDEVDFFDEPVVQLLEEIASDVSYALDTAESESTHIQALEARTEAMAANWAKTNFLSKMSHELRTPLNAVVGFSQLLQISAAPRLTAQEQQQIELIHLAGTQLTALVEDVLDVSRIEAGQVLVSPQDIELSEQLDGALTLSMAAAHSSDVTMLAEYRKKRPMPMRTDPVRLRQVMLNLLSNGIKYNKRGGTVTIDVEIEAEHVVICVGDTGLGMTEGQLGNLFQPFNRLGREATTIVGTGLGMALTRQLVELMGGSIAFSSTPGVGTMFKVRLPFLQVNPPIEIDTRAAQSMATAASDEPAGVVFYVEDNPVNVLLVQQMLRKWSQVQVVVAEDGESAIRLLESMTPDILLLDMQLPDMTGLELLASLRRKVLASRMAGSRMPASRTAAPHMLRTAAHGGSDVLPYPVIALSASAMTDEVEQAHAGGASDYWTKPLDVEVFRRRIAALLPVAAGCATQ